MNIQIKDFLNNYNSNVIEKVFELRQIVVDSLPNIQEVIDEKARMIAYCYGMKYADMVCVIIPSKKGVKLSFYKGVNLKDDLKILKGNGKLTRYIEIDTKEKINIEIIKLYLQEALNLQELKK